MYFAKTPNRMPPSAKNSLPNSTWSPALYRFGSRIGILLSTISFV
ncbi:hypothetical protein ID866_3771 [Astraeus odoratus]|nr:hypothetical protein ID866_3771 [Astraeus odoratus]